MPTDSLSPPNFKFQGTTGLGVKVCLHTGDPHRQLEQIGSPPLHLTTTERNSIF